jgi:hypothetical protein
VLYGFAWVEFNTDESSANQLESFAVLISRESLALTNNFLTISTLI